MANGCTNMYSYGLPGIGDGLADTMDEAPG
jgi:hypothetical protein